MKEKIKQLAKGIFHYKIPSIVLSDEKIDVELEAGKTYEGKFYITNSQKMEMKGVINSSGHLLKLKESAFIGTANCIEYEFSAENLSAGEVIRGEINIVSSCGEVELPFSFTIEAPYCMTSLGKMRDLFHFANLAKADPVEAIALFQSEEFERVFLYQDIKNLIIYKSLIKSHSSSHALEEFLIQIHKKIRINITANRTNCEYATIDESFMDKLILTKDNWGYMELKFSTDVPFIQLAHDTVETENFLGNTYELEYIMNPEFLRAGKNYGRIFIESVYQRITIEILATQGSGKKANASGKKEYILKMIQNYLNFRTNQVANEVYVTDTEGVIEDYFSDKDSILYKLLKTHLYITDGNEDMAKEMITQLEEKEEELKALSVNQYCAYLYLKAFYSKEEEVIDRAVSIIAELYRLYDDWKILWYLLCLDKKYEENKNQKLKDINKHLMKGCHSPILYYEASLIYNENPALLHELNLHTINSLNWALKMNFMSDELAMQYTYLAGREKKFHSLIFHGLKMLYEKRESQDVLAAIIRMLIKGQKTENKYFKWYSLGVEQQLRITELYENYMYSIDEEAGLPLPLSVQLYFVYDNSLTDKKKAYLYSYILKNKELHSSMYHSYIKSIEKYAFKQISLHNINSNLALIYQEILTKDMIDEKIAKDLPYIMFQHEIVCANPNIIGVYVIHKELKKEVYVPFNNGRAQVNIFTESFELFLEDNCKNRYVATIDYTLNKFMNLNDYVGLCYEFNPDHPMLVLNLFEQIESYQKYDVNAINIRMQMLEIPELRDCYVRSCTYSLIQYYYDSFEGDNLNELLLKLNLSSFDNVQKCKIMEIAIIRELNKNALHWVEKYGYEGVSANGLIKLCSKLIVNSDKEEKQDILVEMGYYIFKLGKYNETLLNYLVSHFQGSTKEMYDLWKVADGFEIEARFLEERLLVQMIFAENYLIKAFSVFKSYYKKANNNVVVRAFLSYNAYKYLVNGRSIEPALFTIMKKELYYEENEVTTLALLKFYSEKEMLTKEELKFVDFNLNHFIQKGIILPFFTAYKSILGNSHGICDRYYVEYFCNPGNRVKIHYRIEGDCGEDDFITEAMENVYYGIHVKSFILFSNETLQYYITEESGDGEIITESFSIDLDKKFEESEESRYHDINLILMAREMKDEKTLLELMESYVRNDYLCSMIFKKL